MLGGRIEVQSEQGRGSGKSMAEACSNRTCGTYHRCNLPLATAAFRFFIECRTADDVALRSAHTNGKTPPAQLQVSDSPRRKSVSTISPIKAVKKPSPTRPASSTAVASKAPKVKSEDPLHVLIVEDNIINQTVLKRQMIKSGFTCDGEYLKHRSIGEIDPMSVDSLPLYLILS
jgi:hypothetical protein